MHSRFSRQRGSILLETGLAIGLVGLAAVAAWRMIGDAGHEQSVQHLGQYQQETAKTVIRYLRAQYLAPAWKAAQGTPPAAPGIILVDINPALATSTVPVYPQTAPNDFAHIGKDLLPLGASATGPYGSQSCTVVFGTDTTVNLPLRAVTITHLHNRSTKDLELAARIAGPTTGVVYANGGKLSVKSGSGHWAIDDLTNINTAIGAAHATCQAKPGDLVSAFAVTQSASGTPESALWRTRDATAPQHNIIDTTESGENGNAIEVIDPAPATVEARIDDKGIWHSQFINLTGQGLIPNHDSPLQVTQSVTSGTAGNQRVQFLPGATNTIQNPDGPLSLYADGFAGYTNIPANSAQGLGGKHFSGVSDGTGQGGLPGLSLNGFLQLGSLPDNVKFPIIAPMVSGVALRNSWYRITDNRGSFFTKYQYYPDLKPYQLGRTLQYENDYNEQRGTNSVLNPFSTDCSAAGIGSIMLIPGSPQVAVCMPGPPSGAIATSNLPYDIKNTSYDAPRWEFMMVLGTPYNPALLPRALAWTTWAARQQRKALPLLSAYAAGSAEEPGTESALKLPEQYSKHGGPQHDDDYENDAWASANTTLDRHAYENILAEPDGPHAFDNMCDRGDGCTTATQTTGVQMP